jgi:inorganic pyrophosphatase
MKTGMKTVPQQINSEAKMDFWTRLEQMLDSHEIVIDRPKGSRHPKYPEIVYPFDYGYLEGTATKDGNEIDVCRGTLAENRLVAVICTIDILKQDTEVKLLVGCTEAELGLIDRFFNTSTFMSGIVIRRDQRV